MNKNEVKEVEILETYIKQIQSKDINQEEFTFALRELNLLIPVKFKQSFDFDLYLFEFKSGQTKTLVDCLSGLIQQIKDGKFKL